MDALAHLGNWPSIEIGSHGVIRNAYQNVLNACARLASFATGGPTTTDGPIDEDGQCCREYGKYPHPEIAFFLLQAAVEHAQELQRIARNEILRHLGIGLRVKPC